MRPQGIRVSFWRSLVLLLLFVTPVRNVSAQLLPGYTEIDNVHADLCMPYIGGQWQGFVHTGTAGNFTSYAANEALLIINASTQTTRPAGSEFDFLGVPAGAPLWIASQNQVPGQIYLGVEADYAFDGVTRMLPRNDTNWKRWEPGNGFSSHYVEMSVVDFRGPGVMSVWQSDISGPIIAFDSSDGIGSDDEFRQLVRSHSHYNWGFSAPGRYEIDLRARTFLGPNSGPGTEVVSPITTFFFEVRESSVLVPEPSCLALLLTGFVSLSCSPHSSLRRNVVARSRFRILRRKS
jgi:surface-anchored protein